MVNNHGKSGEEEEEEVYRRDQAAEETSDLSANRLSGTASGGGAKRHLNDRGRLASSQKAAGALSIPSH